MYSAPQDAIAPDCYVYPVEIKDFYYKLSQIP